jgi:hypothetical protein
MPETIYWNVNGTVVLSKSQQPQSRPAPATTLAKIPDSGFALFRQHVSHDRTLNVVLRGDNKSRALLAHIEPDSNLPEAQSSGPFLEIQPAPSFSWSDRRPCVESSSGRTLFELRSSSRLKHWGEANPNTTTSGAQQDIPAYSQKQRLFSTSFHRGGLFSDTYAELTLHVDADGKAMTGSSNKYQLRYEPPTRHADGQIAWMGKLVARVERVDKSRKKADCRIQVAAGMDPILVVILIVASVDSGRSGGGAHMGASGAAAAAASSAASAGAGSGGGGGGGC